MSTTRNTWPFLFAYEASTCVNLNQDVKVGNDNWEVGVNWEGGYIYMREEEHEM